MSLYSSIDSRSRNIKQVISPINGVNKSLLLLNEITDGVSKPIFEQPYLSDIHHFEAQLCDFTNYYIKSDTSVDLVLDHSGDLSDVEIGSENPMKSCIFLSNDFNGDVDSRKITFLNPFGFANVYPFMIYIVYRDGSRELARDALSYPTNVTIFINWARAVINISPWREYFGLPSNTSYTKRGISGVYVWWRNNDSGSPTMYGYSWPNVTSTSSGVTYLTPPDLLNNQTRLPTLRSDIRINNGIIIEKLNGTAIEVDSQYYTNMNVPGAFYKIDVELSSVKWTDGISYPFYWNINPIEFPRQYIEN